MWRWAGTDKLTCGHGLALQELGSGGQESIASLLFERYLVVLYALIFHFSSETKLTCQYPFICPTLLPRIARHSRLIDISNQISECEKCCCVIPEKVINEKIWPNCCDIDCTASYDFMQDNLLA